MEKMNTKLRRDVAESPARGTRLKYQQVKDFVLQQIADGHLKPGDALPPERMLAKKLGRGVHTVRHALDELSQDKIVQRVQGKGTFVNAEEPSNGKQKLDAFALVLPEVNGSLYPSLIKGFIEAAGESHHQVVICDTQMDVRFQGDAILQLLDKNVGGVAIVPTVTPMPAYQLGVLRSQGIPVVFCHRRPDGFAAPLISWPWEEVGRRAGEEIAGRGHRRVAFVAAGRYVVTDGYLKGLRDVLSQRGLDLPDNRVLCHAQTRIAPAEDDVHRMLVEMLEAPDRPTAIFCGDVMEAERVFLEAGRLGLRVPEDLSVVGFGCIHRDGVLSRRLAAVTIDEADLGRQAALMVGQMQAGQESLDCDKTILVPLGFSEGRTLGAAPTELQLAGREDTR